MFKYSYNRFDDWQILTGIFKDDFLCFINLSNKKNLFKHLENKNNVIYNYDNISNIKTDTNNYDKIIINNYYQFKKKSKENNFNNNLNHLLRKNGKLIIFQESLFKIFTYLFLKKKICGWKNANVYSILPYFNSNPMFFMPLRKKGAIKHSLKIIIEISQTISPEVKNNLGIKYNIGIFALKFLIKTRFYFLMKYLSYGYLVEIKMND